MNDIICVHTITDLEMLPFEPRLISCLEKSIYVLIVFHQKKGDSPLF